MKLDRILIIYSSFVSTLLLLAFIVALVLIYWPTEGGDDPVEYLTMEEVSLMDWGIMNLGNSIRRTDTPLLEKHGELVGFLGDKILVTSSTSWEKAPDTATAEKWCSGLINEMKDHFNIEPGTGRPKYGASSNIYIHFQHEGYRSKDEPDDFAERLDEFVELGAVVHVKDSKIQVECYSPLLSTETTYGKIDYGT